jgi:AbrB family looped-hinge helix DNA binding protein
MRITSKGQVTVPKEVRDDLGLKPGSEAGFERNERGEFVLVNLEDRRNETAGERLVRKLKEAGRRLKRDPEFANMTTDEYMELIRGYSEDKDDPGFQHRP